MSNQANRKPEFGNWVSKRLLYVSCTLGLAFPRFSFLLPILINLALFFILAFVYFVFVRLKFSPTSGNLQENIRYLVSICIEWDGHGQAPDIGCGNGPLAIELAKKYSEFKVTGIDYWGEPWDYSQKKPVRKMQNWKMDQRK